MVPQCEIAVWGMAGTPDPSVPQGLVGNGWVRAFFDVLLKDHHGCPGFRLTINQGPLWPAGLSRVWFMSAGEGRASDPITPPQLYHPPIHTHTHTHTYTHTHTRTHARTHARTHTHTHTHTRTHIHTHAHTHTHTHTYLLNYKTRTHDWTPYLWVHLFLKGLETKERYVCDTGDALFTLISWYSQ